ncbi:hypothetical protein [Kutzneria sp. 744]|uniref:hypothetical protein n=1 Tax=Kutzneria sp. (strain 744) TaxID=345341 RepID=UPI0003EEBD6E|nr:hypothetical protein [Kutzneria sp. 744]EWM19159.1 LigA protein [Kutzneria sp. 744]
MTADNAQFPFATGQSVHRPLVFGDIRNVQHEHHVTIPVGDQPTRVPRVTGFIDPDVVAVSARRFVEPPGLYRLLPVLKLRRYLILSGERKSGLWTAGLNMLGECASLCGVELRPRSAVVDEQSSLDDLLGRDDRSHAVLLDLTGTDPVADCAVFGSVAEQLVHFGEQLAHCESFLVVLVPAEVHALFNATVPKCCHPLPVPVATDVFREHLRTAGFAEHRIDDWLSFDELPPLLRRALPGEVARITGLIAGIDPAGSRGPAVLGEDFSNAVRDWTVHLRAEFDSGDEEWRAATTMVALIEHAPCEVLFRELRRFMAILGVPEVGRSRPFAGPGATRRLAAIGATRTSDDRVEFHRPAFGAAVLRYVWQEYPENREHLLRWLADIELGRGTGLYVRDGERLVNRLVELLSGARDARTVLRIAEAWVARSLTCDYLLPMVERLLVKAATSGGIGSAVRKRLYDWAYVVNSDELLAEVVARVCGGIGAEYGNVAMTRLRLLAGWGDRRVGDAVVSAVSAVARCSPAFDCVLEQLVTWIADAEPTRRRVGLAAFRTITDPATHPECLRLVRPAVEDGGSDRAVVAGWRALLKQASTQEVHLAVVAWLNAAAADTEHREVMIDLLADAAGQGADAFVKVGYVCYHWSLAAADEARDAVVALLRLRLDEVDPIVATLAD